MAAIPVSPAAEAASSGSGIDLIIGGVNVGLVLMTGIFFILGLVYFLFMIKKILDRRKIKSGIRISGTAASPSYTKDVPIRKNSKIRTVSYAAMVEFDAVSLSEAGLPYDYPQTEVLTGNVAFAEGDHISCIYLPDSEAFTSAQEDKTSVSSLAIGTIMSVLFMLVPLVVIFKDINPAVIGLVFGIALLGVGMFLLFPALIPFFNKNVIKIEGEVFNVRSNQDNDGGGTSYGYEYTFNYGGKLFRSPPPDAYKSGRRPNTGDTVTVLFNKRTEDFSEKGNLKSNIFGGLITIILSIAFICAAIAGILGKI